MDIRDLEPKILWNYFIDLNAVPRPSKKEERVIKFIYDFGKQLGLETSKDAAGNVIIKKPASAGMENRQSIILQSHLDMVHQKNKDTDFDFSTEGIKMFIDGDWVKAKGTTLGADNGIGVSSIMAILASDKIEHPEIEALFTIDEETGMTGALALEPGLLKSKILLNLDTEDDNELTIGCAGGVDVTATGTYEQIDIPTETAGYKIVIKGLTGGHSGMDIHRGRGNANKLMNRILYLVNTAFNLHICSVEGGSLRNVIPRESLAEIVIPTTDINAFNKYLGKEIADIKAEYSSTDPNLQILHTESNVTGKAVNKNFQEKLLNAIYCCPNGIYRMSPDIEGLVQTSNNLSRVIIKDSSYSIQCLSRSAIDSEKWDLVRSIQAAISHTGAKVEFGSIYPGWTPNPEAKIVKLMDALYEKMYNEKVVVDKTLTIQGVSEANCIVDGTGLGNGSGFFINRSQPANLTYR
ncbi:MAG: aminoacyl-histidine dipeptidase, partial [Bacteroidia bacterium]